MQILTNTKNKLYNCLNCYDVGYLSMACNATSNIIYCNCKTGRKLAIESTNTNRRIH